MIFLQQSFVYVNFNIPAKTLQASGTVVGYAEATGATQNWKFSYVVSDLTHTADLNGDLTHIQFHGVAYGFLICE